MIIFQDARDENTKTPIQIIEGDLFSFSFYDLIIIVLREQKLRRLNIESRKEIPHFESGKEIAHLMLSRRPARTGDSHCNRHYKKIGLRRCTRDREINIIECTHY